MALYSPEMRSDLELLEAWRGGDTEAGNELVERHFTAVRRFFRNKLPATEVEDALQRTFLACVEGRDRFRGDASFRTYLFTIARHQLYRQIRTRSRDAVAAGLDFSVSSLDDLGISPSANVARNEEHAMIWAALRRLPVDFQIMLELYYWEQLKGPEIAAVMEISPVTVRTRLHRARQALKEQLERNDKRAWEQLEVETRNAAPG